MNPGPHPASFLYHLLFPIFLHFIRPPTPSCRPAPDAPLPAGSASSQRRATTVDAHGVTGEGGVGGEPEGVKGIEGGVGAPDDEGVDLRMMGGQEAGPEGGAGGGIGGAGE